MPIDNEDLRCTINSSETKGTQRVALATAQHSLFYNKGIGSWIHNRYLVVLVSLDNLIINL